MTVLDPHSDNAGKVRALALQTPGMPASDGDGVKLTRIVGSPQLDMVDPFLLLDCFESDRPGDYIGGFPDHPHRGFETVTYLLAGRMRHKDSTGREGVIEPGGIQWMTAGRGIIHSEMPEQEDGLLMGFQLWVNLPARDKMMPPAYQEFAADQIPVEALDGGGSVRVITGRTDAGTEGPVKNALTDPLYLDVALPAGTAFYQQVPDGHNAMIYAIDGTPRIGARRAGLPTRSLGVLTDGDRIEVTATDADTRFLVIAAKSLNEPVARGGPFVMNTKQEVLQAFHDYQHGRF